MKRKVASQKVRKTVRRPVRKYVFGTPFKSLAKTQAALFGVAFLLMCHPFQESLCSLKVNNCSLKVNGALL